jgi:hypothetical protein
MSNKTKSNRGGARYRTVRRKHRHVPRRHRNNSRKHSLSGIPRRIMHQITMAKIQKQMTSMQAMARGSPPSSPSASYGSNGRTMRALDRAIGSMGSLGSKYMPISHKKRRQSHRMSVNK